MGVEGVGDETSKRTLGLRFEIKSSIAVDSIEI